MIEVVIHNEKQGDHEIRAMIPESLKEMSAISLTKCLVVCEQMSETLEKFFALPAEQQSKIQKGWDDVQLSEYFSFLIEILCAASGKDLEFMKEVEVNGHSKSLIPLAYRVLSAIYTYKPKEREHFTYKGQKYIFPTSVVVNIGEMSQTTFGPKMKTGAVIEALHRRHVFSAKDDKGNMLMPDGVFYSDLGMIASLSRKILPNGQEESVPIGIAPFADWVNVRMEELKDLPADIFRDAGFFLMASHVRYVKTTMSEKSSKLTGRKAGTGKKRKKSLDKRK